jgi:transposase InsO family protein
MGVVIQAESHRHELALLYVLEHDPDVLAYWDQPEGIKISYLSANGRPTSPVITLDYFVVRKNGVEWIEVKPHEALPELAKEMPHRFVLDGAGKWTCPPAESVAKNYGFTYRIWTSNEVSSVWLRNIELLADYFDADLNRVPADLMAELKEAVRNEPGIMLGELRRRCQSASADHLNILLTHNELYVDLSAVALTDPDRVCVYGSREVAEAHALLQMDLQSEEGDPPPVRSTEVAEFLRHASLEDYAEANRRCRILTDPAFAVQNPVAKRTLRRWLRLFRLAKERYGHGYVGLLPRLKDRGNRNQRLSDGLLTLVDHIIDKVYCTPTRPNKRYAYEQLRLECEQKGFFAPSYPSFTKRIRLRSKFELTMARQGKRAAHKYELISPGVPNDNHGTYPYDVGLTDHTLIDTELICAITGENLGRAWLSILVDGFSRRILAFCLTFDPPSYRTLMMLTRRCVERHSRLPRCLLVDGGKEFQSTYFETLTAAYGVLVKRRPPGKARFGSVVERLFGTINTAFLHTLQGNTQNTKAVRQLVKSMDPKRLAAFTLEEAHDLFATFAYDLYDQRPHPTLNCSPREQFTRGLEIAGTREHRMILNDEAFHLMTLPTTPKGTAKVQPGMGVKIFGFYYWAEDMRSRHWEGKSVRIKYDPENLGMAWVYLGGQWVQCRPGVAFGLEGRTEKEIRIAMLELRRSRQLLGQRQSSSNRALAEFLKSAQAAKVLRLQQAKDSAQRRIRAATSAAPGDAAQDTKDSLQTPDQPTATPAKPSEEPTPTEGQPGERPKDYGDF